MTMQISSVHSDETTLKPPGLTIAQKLIAAFLGFVLVLGILLTLAYRQYVPPLVHNQIELRVESVTKSFAAAAFKPMVEQNFIQVNKLAEGAAALPDVAYAAAVNEQGIVMAGIFGKMDDFSPDFTAAVKQNGFPSEIIDIARPADGQESHKTVLTAGGQEIMDYALRLPQTGSVVHVGLFMANVNAAVAATLEPLLFLLAALALIGSVVLILVARTVSRPIRLLSEQAEKISMGNLDDTIDIHAGGEVWLLTQSFKRMLASIRYMTLQIQQNQKNTRGG